MITLQFDPTTAAATADDSDENVSFGHLRSFVFVFVFDDDDSD